MVLKTKAISAIIATIMLLMISVSLIGVFYVFSSGIATTSTSSASEQASQLTSQLSMCMRIDNINGNQVLLTNCGKGVIENKSLVVMMDDAKMEASTATIQEGNSSVVNVSGLWQISPGRHTLKISNSAYVAQALVEVKPNPDGLAGSWDFNEGTGTATADGSWNGNVGTLLPADSEPQWVSGKFGKGLQFDGTNDYVDSGSGASLNFTGAITIEAWIKPLNNNAGILFKVGGIVGLCTGSGYLVRILADNRLQAYFANGCGSWAIQSSSTIPTGRFTHIVVVNNVTTAYLYINDVLDSTSTTISPTANDVSLKIGISPPGWSTNYFQGTIDGVRIWSRALAPDETMIMKQII